MPLATPPPAATEVAEQVAPVAASAADRVAQAVVAYAMDRCDAVTVEVRWLGLAVDVPADAELMIDGDPCLDVPQLRLSAVRRGLRVGAWTLRPSLAITVVAPVAPRDLAAGEAFEPVPGAAPLSEVRGIAFNGLRAVASRPLRAGDAITARVARAAPDVPRGRPIQVEVARGPISIRADGELLQDGFIGRVVQVRNHATGAVHRGVLVDAATVRLP